MIGGGGSLGKLVVYLGADTADLVTEFSKAEREAAKFSKSLDNALKVGLAAAAAGLAAAAVGIGAAIKQATDRADELAKAAQKAGVEVEKFSKLNFAAALSDVSTEQLQGAFTQLSKRIVDESSKASQALEALGVKTRDAYGQLRPSDQILTDISGLFADMSDGATKAALAQELFGKSGVALIPLLNSGANGLRDMTKEAEALGLVVSGGLAESSQQLNDNVTRMSSAFTGFGNQLAERVVPALADLSGGFVKFITDSGLVYVAADGIVNVMKGIVISASLVKQGMDVIARAVIGVFETAAESINFLIRLAESAAANMKRTASGLAEFLRGGDLSQIAKESAGDFGSTFERELAAHSARVKTIWSATADGMREDIDDLVGALESLRATQGTATGPTAEQLANTQRIQELLQRLANSSKTAAAAEKERAEAERLAAEATRDAEQAANGFDQILQRLLERYRPAEAAQRKYAEEVLKLVAAHTAGKKTTEELTDAVTLLQKEFADTAAEAAKVAAALTPFQRAVQSLMFEIDDMRAGDSGRLEAEFRRVTESLGPLTAAEEGVIRNLLAMKQEAENFAAVLGPISDAMSSALGNFGTEVLFNFDNIDSAVKDLGDSMLDTIKRTVAQMLTEIARLQIINPLLNSILGSSLPTGGMGNIAGTLFGGGSGGAGGILGGLFGGGGAATGAGNPGGLAGLGGNVGTWSGGGGSIAGAIPIIGWIVAGMMANMSMFSQGWRAGGGSLTLPNGQNVQGGSGSNALGNALTAGGITTLDRALRGIGLSSSIASLLSGSSIHARLFGRAAPVLTGASTTYTLGADGPGGSESYRTLERGGLFRSDRRRTHTSALGTDAAQAARDLFDSISATMTQAARQLEGTAPEMIAAALRTVQEFDSKGKVKATKFFVDILGRTWEEATAEAATTRINAEGIIATIDAILGTTVAGIEASAAEASTAVGSSATGIIDGITSSIDDAIKNVGQVGEASAIAERWRGDAETLMDGAQFLLAAATDIRRGTALLGDATLTDLVDFVETQQQATESLIETYTRLAAATQVYEAALATMGQVFDGTRQQLVEFAADFAQAAGGVQQAASLWQDYFNVFYTEGERLQAAVDAARNGATRELGDIGLDPNTAREAFRAQFEAIRASLTPEDLVQWLEAGRALGILFDAEGRLADYRTNEARAAADAVVEAERTAAEARERLAEATQRQTDFTRGLTEQLQDDGLSEFGQRLAGVTRRYRDNIATAQELGDATGDTAATMRSMALAARIARNGLAEVRQALIESIQGLVQQLGYRTQLAIQNTGLGDGTPEPFGTFGGGGGVSNNPAVVAANDFFDQLRSGFESLEQWLNQSIFGELSGLSPEAQYSEVLQQINAASALIRGGGEGAAEALAGFPELLNRFLTLSRQINASGSNFTADTEFARALAAELLAMRDLITGPGGTGLGGGDQGGGGGFTGDTIGSTTTGGGATTEADRLLLATQLAQQLRELAAITAQPLLDLAQTFGVDLEGFFADLGVDLTDLSATNVLHLGNIANQLGVDLGDIDTALGLGLGDIADALSPINDAVEQLISGLTPELQALFAPLLLNLQNAETPEERAAARTAFINAILASNPDIQQLFAPFFAEINQTDELSDILDQITDVSQYTGETVDAVYAVQRSVDAVSAPIVSSVTALTGTTADGLAAVVVAINAMAAQATAAAAAPDKAATAANAIPEMPTSAAQTTSTQRESGVVIAIERALERIAARQDDQTRDTVGLIGRLGDDIRGGLERGDSRRLAAGGSYGC